jgi:hypothetical protein
LPWFVIPAGRGRIIAPPSRHLISVGENVTGLAMFAGMLLGTLLAIKVAPDIRTWTEAAGPTRLPPDDASIHPQRALTPR